MLAVCKRSFEFLVSINDEPLIDIDQVNEHLYEHVSLLHEAMVYSYILFSLSDYNVAHRCLQNDVYCIFFCLAVFDSFAVLL